MQDDEFDKAFAGFGEDEQPKDTPEDSKESEDEKVEPPKEEEKKEEETSPEDLKEKVEDEEPPKKEEKKEEPEQPETPPEEPPKPLTSDDVRSIISELRNEERSSGRELDDMTNEVLEKYYPDGLSNTLIDQSTGKELKTPQDVVDASNGSMSIEEASQWLMNEQYKLDKEIDRIKSDAQNVAETTIRFKTDSKILLEKYKDVFESYPQVQQKVWEQYKKLIKSDEEKGVILSAPDMQEFYDAWLEPYKLAYEHKTSQPAPEPPKPKAEDRMDISGDGESSGEVDDPNDFAQQVKKELAKGL